ncbi:MAG: AEC family transporter [Firmicutes bacterium]|nr:AEC family transporter [Bacillota bacterium]
MENLTFALNSTMPVFLLMVCGVFFRKMGLIDEEFTKKANNFVFKVTLPCLMVKDLAQQDFVSVWDGKFVLFCFGATVISIFISAMLSFTLKDKGDRGEFIQASYRSSAAILGIAFIENIYGNVGMAPLMIIGSVPLYNAMAVVVLSFTKPGMEKMDSKVIVKTLKGVVTNPIIIGIVIGLLWSLLDIPRPAIMFKTLNSIASLTTPLGILSMGAAFNFAAAGGKLKPAVAASFMKLICFAGIFLPLAVAFGFRTDKLVAILIMLSSPTTVSAYIMAKSMGHDGTLTANAVALTTLGCSITLTMWLFVLKSGGFI